VIGGRSAALKWEPRYQPSQRQPQSTEAAAKRIRHLRPRNFFGKKKLRNTACHSGKVGSAAVGAVLDARSTRAVGPALSAFWPGGRPG